MIFQMVVNDIATFFIIELVTFLYVVGTFVLFFKNCSLNCILLWTRRTH